jgi:hypothetical protein
MTVVAVRSKDIVLAARGVSMVQGVLLTKVSQIALCSTDATAALLLEIAYYILDTLDLALP